MNLFDKNRNDLSKYFYDLSKAVVLTAVIIPFFSEKGELKMSIARIVPAMLCLIIGAILKKGD